VYLDSQVGEHGLGGLRRSFTREETPMLRLLPFQQDHDAQDGTLDLGRAQVKQERYQTALGGIQSTASVAGQCSCYMVVEQVARDALTPPATSGDYWLHCEA